MNISTESTSHIYDLDPGAQSSRDSFRSLRKLELTLERLFLLHGINRILFITCTFPGGMKRKDAKDRFDRLLRKLRSRYGDYLWVYERGHGGHVHFHLLLVVDFDTREGVDLAAYSRLANDAMNAKRKLVNKATRNLWTMVDEACREFGIGRTEVAPIYSCGEAVTRYLVKSVKHNWHNRKMPDNKDKKGDKGACWWSCSRSLKAVYGRFSFHPSRFRLRTGEYAREQSYPDIDALKDVCGPRWAWEVMQWNPARDSETGRERIGGMVARLSAMEVPSTVPICPN
ncbi:MAG: hypothetical protein J0M04_08465 [Verrucomicrobia bacterium]|nr:hypothetical protein [Verrucomicrobiota bacterium]